MESFGEQLKKIRESRSMTVNQLAMYSKISAASISRYETGERGTPKPDKIRKLSAALKYPYKDLMKIAGYYDEEEEEFEEMDNLSEPKKNMIKEIKEMSDEEVDYYYELFIRLKK